LNSPAGTVVSAVILAAGKSERFGKTKQLAALGNKTVLQCTVDNFTQSSADEIIVVLGYKYKEILKRLGHTTAKLVFNPEFETGMGSSLVEGIKHVRKDADGILLALADQPFIDSITINRLIDVFKSNTKGIIIPVYQEHRGNPVILSVKYREELLQIQGDTGGREIVKRHPEDILEVEVDCKGVLTDIDTPEQYNSALREILPDRQH